MRRWLYKWFFDPFWDEVEASDRETYPITFANMDVVWPCIWIQPSRFLFGSSS